MKDFFGLLAVSFFALTCICALFFITIWGFECFIKWEIVKISIDLFKLRVVISAIFGLSLYATIDMLRTTK